MSMSSRKVMSVAASIGTRGVGSIASSRRWSSSAADTVGIDLFGKQAKEYSVYRPQYPPAMIEWVLSSLPTANQQQIDRRNNSDTMRGLAVDIGTGTGQVAVPLAKSQLFSRVIGVDRSLDQLAHTPSDIANLTFKQGDAMALNEIVPAQSCALITAAQMAHWLTGSPEAWKTFTCNIKSCLEPEIGRFAVLGYGLCQFDQDQDLQRRFMDFYNNTESLWNPACDRKVCTPVCRRWSIGWLSYTDEPVVILFPITQGLLCEGLKLCVERLSLCEFEPM
jgi:SAM-dependent methyltransferase